MRGGRGGPGPGRMGMGPGGPGPGRMGMGLGAPVGPGPGRMGMGSGPVAGGWAWARRWPRSRRMGAGWGRPDPERMREMRERWSRLDPEKKKEMIGRFQALRAASQKKEVARTSDAKPADKKGAGGRREAPLDFAAGRPQRWSSPGGSSGPSDRPASPQDGDRHVSKAGHRGHRHGHGARRHRDGDRHVSKAGHRGGGHGRHWGGQAGHRHGETVTAPIWPRFRSPCRWAARRQVASHRSRCAWSATGRSGPRTASHGPVAVSGGLRRRAGPPRASRSNWGGSRKNSTTSVARSRRSNLLKT